MMHLLIADAAPTDIKSWLDGGVYILVVAVAVKKLFFGGVPQPMVTKEADEYVHRGSYESHCKINREEHNRIESKCEEERKGLEKSHNALAREVSAISATLEANGLRLVQVDQKIDVLLKRS